MNTKEFFEFINFLDYILLKIKNYQDKVNEKNCKEEIKRNVFNCYKKIKDLSENLINEFYNNVEKEIFTKKPEELAKKMSDKTNKSWTYYPIINTFIDFAAFEDYVENKSHWIPKEDGLYKPDIYMSHCILLERTKKIFDKIGAVFNKNERYNKMEFYQNLGKYFLSLQNKGEIFQLSRDIDNTLNSKINEKTITFGTPVQLTINDYKILEEIQTSSSNGYYENKKIFNESLTELLDEDFEKIVSSQTLLGTMEKTNNLIINFKARLRFFMPNTRDSLRKDTFSIIREL